MRTIEFKNLFFSSKKPIFKKTNDFLGMFSKKLYIKDVNRFLDIYQFTHFRKFLEEYQATRAKVDSHFTRTEICNLLGLEKSRSYFADVLRGKKVSPRMVQKFIEILELDKKEAKYFETLVELDQAKSDAARNAAMQEVLKLHPNPQHILNEDAYEYYSHWYNSALFAILDAMDVGDDMAPVWNASDLHARTRTASGSPPKKVSAAALTTTPN